MKRFLALMMTLVTILTMGLLPENSAQAASNDLLAYLLKPGTQPVYTSSSLSTRGTETYGKSSTAYVDENDEMVILDYSTKWVKVQYKVGSKKAVGYIPADTVFNGKAGATKKSTGKFYVSLTKTGAIKKGSNYVDKGEQVTVFGSKTNGRYQIKYPTSNGKYRLGWCNASDYETYILGKSTSVVTTAPRTSSTKSKTLNVNLLKQTDSKWKNTKIKSKTIGDVGCLVTSIAMIKSYETGKSVTPVDIVKQCKFSGNDLVWNSVSGYSFTKTTSLRDVYDSINAGRPVLVSAYKGNKNWHWMVIYGYQKADPNNLKTSDFLVRDPMGKHTTVDSFLKERPYGLYYMTYTRY